MKPGIPKIKKKINAFLVGEEGKISKQSLLKVGAMLGGAALGTVLSARKAYAGHSSSDSTCDRCEASNDVCHGNLLGVTSTGATIESSHEHCIETHSSHRSHGSHNSW